MKKHYSNVLRILIYSGIISGLALIAAGIWIISIGYLPPGSAACILGIVISLFTIVIATRRGASVKQMANIVDDEKQQSARRVLQVFPLPIAIMHIDGDIIWYNNEFESMVSTDVIFGHSIEDIIPSLKWGDILKSGDVIEKTALIGKDTYSVTGRIYIDNLSKNNFDKYTVYLFFENRTHETELERLYNEDRADVAILSIDNYDYIAQKTDETEAQNPFYKLNRIITGWVRESGGVIKKTDRDKYFIVFEHKYLDVYINDKFSVISQVRALAEEMHIPMSVSIGVGSGGSVTENEANARNALELAIGRGGDQAAVKDESQYRFYGGKAREYDKSTKLKTRAVASALLDFIRSVDNVIIMGHHGLDYDGFGAAMGLQRAIRSLDKKAYIVYDTISAIEKLHNEFVKLPEYNGLLVTPQEAENIAGQNTLLLIVDTHRPSLLPNPQLLNKTDKIVLIDHHRRATEFINNTSLVYLEPFASSTCEMVTELIQYMTTGGKLNSFEAECLYMGIVMDTKNFLLKTGVRTFEAASYLRQCGLDTVNVKRLFTVDMNDYIKRAEIVSSAKFVTANTAVSVCSQPLDNMRVIAAQAADDMLNIDQVEASFVLYPLEKGGTGISGRSLGSINVQLILEKLGGGGHQSVAGAQLPSSLHTAEKELREAIIIYEKEQAEDSSDK